MVPFTDLSPPNDNAAAARASARAQAPGFLGRLGSYPELKLWRPDLNERAYHLTRAELERVYGRTALRGALAQARSLRELAPGLLDQRRLTRERALRIHRRKALEQKLRSLQIKAQQLAKASALGEVQREIEAELSEIDAAVRALDVKLAQLSATVLAGRDKVPAGARQMSLVEQLRRETFPEGSDRALVISVLKSLEEASHAATGAGLREMYEVVLRESLEPLMLAAPSGEDRQAFCRKTLMAAAELLKRILRHATVKGMEPRGRAQFLEELIWTHAYPGYRGEVVIAFGGTESPPTIRVPSYILPGLAVMEEFRNAGRPVPRLRVLNAYAMAVEFNGVRDEAGRAVAERTAALLGAFVEKFFPQFVNDVVFTLPRYDDFTANAVFQTGVNHLREFARQYPDNKQLGSLLKKATRHSRKADGDPERGELVRIAAGYVASHIVECSFGDVRTHAKGEWQPDFVIKVGGDGETDFNFFQDVLANLEAFGPDQQLSAFRPNSTGWPKAGFQITPIQINAAVGSTPPYYALGTGEVLIDRVAGFSFDDLLSYYRSDSRLKTVAIDLELLPPMGVPGEAFLSFLNAFAHPGSP